MHEDITSSFDFVSTRKETVLITACNFGYVNHLYNFKCFMDRLGFKFVVFALDGKLSYFCAFNEQLYLILLVKREQQLM